MHFAPNAHDVIYCIVCRCSFRVYFTAMFYERHANRDCSFSDNANDNAEYCIKYNMIAFLHRNDRFFTYELPINKK